MDLIKNRVINLFKNVLNWGIDLYSWTRIDFIQFCKEQNYENPSLEVFAKRFKEDQKTFKDAEKIRFKYCIFANKYLTVDGKESFLNKVYTAHYEHFHAQSMRGFRV